MSWFEEAKEKLTYLQSIFSERNEDFACRDAIYELDHDRAFGWEAPKDDTDLRFATAEPVKMVRHIAGLFMSNPIRLVATPRKATQEGNRISGQLEKFLLGVLQANEERFGQVMLRGVLNGGVRGWGAWRVTWNVERAETDEEEQTVRGCPLEWQDVDPGCLYYEAGGKRERFNSCMYAVEKRQVDIERAWDVSLDGEKQPSPHDSGDDLITVVDYWYWQDDTIYNAVWAGDTVLKEPVPMPGYSRLPYITWFTQPSHRQEPRLWGTGWLHAIREAVKAYDRGINRQLRRLTFAADNAYILVPRQPDHDQLPQDFELNIEAGKINTLPYGWQLEPLQNVGPSAEANMIMQLAAGEIHAVGMPEIASGNLPNGNTDMAGVTMQGIMDVASTWLSQDVDGYVAAISQVCDLITSLCGYYSPERKVQIAAMTPGKGGKPVIELTNLTGRQMQGFRLDVLVDTETAADKMRKKQIGMQLAQMDPLRCPYSLRTIQQTFFDIDDPDGEDEQKLVEQIGGRPELTEYMAALAARKYGLPEPPQEPQPQPVAAQTPAQTPAGMPMMPGQMNVPAGLAQAMMGQQAAMGLAGPAPELISQQAMGGSPPPLPTSAMPPQQQGMMML